MTPKKHYTDILTILDFFVAVVNSSSSDFETYRLKLYDKKSTADEPLTGLGL